MSLKGDMHTALMTVALTAPAQRSQYYAVKKGRYITYFEYNRQPEIASDDATAANGRYWQIDLWSAKDDKTAATMEEDEAKIEIALKPLGFGDFTYQDLYEEDTGISHYAIRCYLLEEV